MKNTILSMLLLASILCISTSCSDDDEAAPVKQFVLVHGSWQGAFVWNDVKELLEEDGHNVTVVELPAHGEDNTSPTTVSMSAYRDKVIAAIDALPEGVILVGHSMGGAVITATAEAIPNKLEKLIYIGAFVPGNGETLLELAGEDTQSLLEPALEPSDDMLTLGVKQDQLINIFCQDCAQEEKELLLAKYRTEPAIPFTNLLTVTEANYGQVDKYYIHTAQDHTIGINLQNDMAEAAGITQTYTLNSGHSPFLSMPDKVTETLIKILDVKK